MAEDKIGQIMSRPVRTVKPDEKLTAAVAVMDNNNIGSVVVLDGETAIGIITEGDVVEQVSKGAQVLLEPVKQVMSKPLITGTPDMAVQDAVNVMLEKRIRQLPIIEGSKLVGIVTDRDLMRSVLRVSSEKLSKLKLRELELEGATIAAQIVTLLNL
ncbi:MAG: CBS domain-containing protein [Candidatus Bathyarchaeia archaeon]|jgi:CBS domain-containing protein